MKSLFLPVALLICLSVSTFAWAEIGMLIRQEVRRTASGESVLVCIYAVGSHEVERVYPIGNFCPKYVEE